MELSEATSNNLINPTGISRGLVFNRWLRQRVITAFPPERSGGGNAALSGVGVPALREWGTRHRSGHAAQRRIVGQ